MTRDYVGEALGTPQGKASGKQVQQRGDVRSDGGAQRAGVVPFVDESIIFDDRSAAGWPALDRNLISDDRTPAPALDYEALPPSWVGLIDKVAQDCGSSPDYIVAYLLGVASAVIGNTRRVSAWSSWVEQPFLWIAAVGLPSSGKTPALDPFHHACIKLQQAMRPDYDAALAEYRRKAEVAEATKSAYQAELKAAAKEKTIPPPRPDNIDDPEEPRPPRVWIADSTIEELQAQLAANPRGLVLIRSELAAWLGQFERYGGGDSERGFYLECWDGRAFVVDRVKLQGKRLEIPNASLSIVGSVQPDKLASSLQQANDGLIARVLFVYPDPVPPTRPTDPEGAAYRRVQIAEALAQLRSLDWDRDKMGNQVPRIIKLDTTAADLCQDFRIKNHEAIASGSAHPILNGWRGKNDGRLLRIAAVFEFLEWAIAGGAEPLLVSATSVQRAWRYLSYCEEMFEHVLGDLAHTEAHRDAAQIARHIRDQGLRVLSERELYRLRGFRHLRDPERRKAAFSELEAAGWIRKNVGVKNGRPRNDWQVHPSVRSEVQIVVMSTKVRKDDTPTPCPADLGQLGAKPQR